MYKNMKTPSVALYSIWFNGVLNSDWLKNYFLLRLMINAVLFRIERPPKQNEKCKSLRFNWSLSYLPLCLRRIIMYRVYQWKLWVRIYCLRNRIQDEHSHTEYFTLLLNLWINTCILYTKIYAKCQSNRFGQVIFINKMLTMLSKHWCTVI